MLIYLFDKLNEEKKIELFKLLEKLNTEQIKNYFYVVKNLENNSQDQKLAQGLIKFNNYCFFINLKKEEIEKINKTLNNSFKISIFSLIESLKGNEEISKELLDGLIKDLSFFLSLCNNQNEQNREDNIEKLEKMTFIKFFLELIKNLRKFNDKVNKESFNQLIKIINNFYFYSLGDLLSSFNYKNLLLNDKTAKIYKKLYFNVFKSDYSLFMSKYLNYSYSSFPLIFKEKLLFDLKKLKELFNDFKIKNNFYIYLINLLPHFFFYLGKNFNFFLNKFFESLAEQIFKGKIVIFFTYKNYLIVISNDNIDNSINKAIGSLVEEYNLLLKDKFVLKTKKHYLIYFLNKKFLFMHDLVLVDDFLVNYYKKQSDLNNLIKNIKYLEALFNFNIVKDKN
ncbi:MAG: hypothetical protein ABGW69_02520 [Nanoarchaeota archaeon]